MQLLKTFFSQLKKQQANKEQRYNYQENLFLHCKICDFRIKGSGVRWELKWSNSKYQLFL